MKRDTIIQTKLSLSLRTASDNQSKAQNEMFIQDALTRQIIRTE